jgi:hypothetical protein
VTRIKRVTLKNRSDAVAPICFRGVIEDGDLGMAEFRFERLIYIFERDGSTSAYPQYVRADA